MIIFLDLELTLIKEWNTWGTAEFLLPEIEKIAALMTHMEDEGHKVEMGLMSWAVWHELDKQNFNKKLRPELERLLGRTFTDKFVWSMDDWGAQVLKYGGKAVTMEDMMDMFHKQEVLFVLSRVSPDFTGQSVVLIDDAVEDGLSWHSPNNQCRVMMLNITDA